MEPRRRRGAGRSDYTYRLPLAARSHSDAEYAVIESAQQILARDCMKGFGLSYRPVRESTFGATQDRRYGISEFHGKAVPDAGCLGSAVRKPAEPYAYPAGVAAASTISAQGFRASIDAGPRRQGARAEAGIQRGMIRERITVLRRLRDLHRHTVSAARRIVSGT
ncbi:hypothetical protein ACWDZX_17350 [Streptomyces collinus]